MTGFTDAEASFTVAITKSKTHKIGWSVNPRFVIDLHKKELPLLNKLQSFFGVGNIYFSKDRKTASFVVHKHKEIYEKILPHFYNFPLLTQKKEDFILFKLIIELMIKGQHLTLEGLEQILSVRASLNLGLSDNLKSEFPNIIPMSRSVSSLPLSLTAEEFNPYWLVGFSEGEGSFFVGLTKSNLYKAGYQVSCRFLISQHNRDIA